MVRFIFSSIIRLISATVNCSGAFTHYSDSNLIRNPGFYNDVPLLGRCVGGPISSILPEFSIAKAEFISKPASMYMFSNNPNAHGYISQKIPISGGKSYKMQVNFKTAGVTNVH